MINLKEIPIGELTKELLSMQFVYCKYNDNPLVKVDHKSNMNLEEIQDAKFYIEDTSEGESELTYGNLYYEFLKHHETIKRVISDYRPANKPFTLFVWLKDVPLCFEVTFLHELKAFQWRVTSND